VTVDWGDGTAATTLNLAAGIRTFTTPAHQYLNNRSADAAYPIAVTVTADEGSRLTGGTSVTVNNVAPANLQLSLSAAAIDEHGSATLSGTLPTPARSTRTP